MQAPMDYGNFLKNTSTVGISNYQFRTQDKILKLGGSILCVRQVYTRLFILKDIKELFHVQKTNILLFYHTIQL